MEKLTQAELDDLTVLLRRLSKIDEWLGLVSSDQPSGAWQVHPRSPLATDNNRTHPYQVSQRAWMALNVAVDFLHCLRRSLSQVSQDKVNVWLHPYAQLGLVRGAIENACCAIWLVGPSRLERITNRLSLEWRELADSYRLRELAGTQPPRTRQEREQQLVSLLLATNFPYTVREGHDPQAEAERAARATLRGAGYARMVRRAGELVPAIGADRAEATWKMCSALAHGDASATLGLLSSEVLEQVQPGIKLVKVALPVQLLMSAGLITITLIDTAFDLFKKWAQAHY